MESAGSPPNKPRGALGGRFWLEEQLGSDASGELHRGIDLRSGTATAVRIVRGIGAARREKMLRETKRAAQVKHPGLAVVLGVGQTDEGDIFVAAETIGGDRLSDRLRVGERFDDWEAAEIATQIAHAVAAAHDADVVHRELRPSLVVLTYEGDNTIVKVEGLGLPRTPTEDDPELAYAAPEQRRGDTVGRRADVYSIGAMLSAMLTGNAPGPDDALIEGPLGAVVKLCLAADPRERYADTNALTAAMTITAGSLPPRVPSRMPMAESNPPPDLMPLILMPKALDLTAEAAGIPEEAQPPSGKDDVEESPPSPFLVPSQAPPPLASQAPPEVVASAPPPAASSTIPPAAPVVPDRPAPVRPKAPPASPAPSAFMAGPWPRAFVAAVLMFVFARLLTSTFGAFVAAIAAAGAFYVAWTQSRREPPKS